ncbi:MAG: TIGR01777 family oxidoreductase [Campylobacterales bacterium]
MKQASIVGASGFVGRALTAALKEAGWRVISLGRLDMEAPTKTLRERLEESSLVVNLAGAPILARWSEAYKKELYESRVTTTARLVEAMSLLANKPDTFVSTSAVGLYAPGGPHTESSYRLGNDFLSLLCQEWERRANEASLLGVRTVITRFGVVLGAGGGALAQMLPIFKLGLGGVIGSGKQPFPWIHLDDLVLALLFVVSNSHLEGAFNFVAPEIVNNKEMTKTLAQILRRPAFLPVPEFALRLLYGEGARVLTSGQEVVCERLLASGFVFRYPTLRSALESIIYKG